MCIRCAAACWGSVTDSATGSRAASIAIGTLLAAAAAGPGAATATAHPLLDYANTLTIDSLPDEYGARDELRAAQRLLDAAQPPADRCNAVLGARRYALLFRDVALADEALGDYAQASRHMQRAIECSPRDADLLALLAGQMMLLGRRDEARQTLARGLDAEPGSFELRAALMRLQFLEEHWDDVVDNARSLIDTDPDDGHTVYWQIMLHLAQERGGLKISERPPHTSEPDWPTAIWLTLSGQMTPLQLTQQIAAAADEKSRRQRLCEALFYIGEQYLARGARDTARRHFALATRMKILNFVEHGLALGELSKLRAR